MKGLYEVKMKHDKGIIMITTYAESAQQAKEIVCKAEMAPLRSALAVELLHEP